MKLTVEQTRMLAAVQRDMDAGKLFFVVFKGERLSVLDEVAEELGLERGQTVNLAIVQSIVEASIAVLETKMAMPMMASGSV